MRLVMANVGVQCLVTEVGLELVPASAAAGSTTSQDRIPRDALVTAASGQSRKRCTLASKVVELHTTIDANITADARVRRPLLWHHSKDLAWREGIKVRPQAMQPCAGSKHNVQVEHYHLLQR